MEKKTRIIKLEHKDGTVLINGKKYHLYFINNDEIKKGDWCLNTYANKVFKYETLPNVNNNNNIKKIIATTDKSLSIGTDLEKGNSDSLIHLPQPSQAFIEKYCKVGGIDEVLVEYEKDTIKNRKEFSRTNIPIVYYKLKINSHNEITIHPIKNSWSREEVETLLFKYASDEWGVDSSHQDIKQFNNWIKENL